MLSSLPGNKFACYLHAIEDKLNGARQVDYCQRETYVMRLRSGPGQPIKVETNFNNQN